MLQSKNVFIDTQQYVKSGLHFDSSAYKAFAKLCSDGEISHLSTSIIKREVESKINDAIKDAINSLHTFQRKAKILKDIQNEPISHLFQEIDPSVTHELAIGAFHSFLETCKTHYVPLAVADIEMIVNDYFGKKAPFGEGKKKNEFPDAISLNAIKNFSDGDNIYVISEDNDLKNFCNANDNFISLETLEQFLNIYNTHKNKISDAINRYIESIDKELKADITSSLNSAVAYNVSGWEDSEILIHKVSDISDIDASIISMNDEYCKVTFEIDVEFDLKVSGPDFTNGYWDSEDKIMIPMEKTTVETSETKTFTVEMDIYYEILEDEINNVEYEIDISGLSNDMEFSVEENQYDWY